MKVVLVMVLVLILVVVLALMLFSLFQKHFITVATESLLHYHHL